jgi:cytidine deaminase
MDDCDHRALLEQAAQAARNAYAPYSIAIAALDPLGEPIACAPCGACRQAILEFGAEAEVIFRTSGDAVAVVTATALLPGAFSFKAV